MHRRTALIAAGSAALVTITAGAAFASGHDDTSPEVRPVTSSTLSSVTMPSSTVARRVTPKPVTTAARAVRPTTTTATTRTTVEDRDEARGREAEGEAPRGQDGARDAQEARGRDDRGGADHSGPGRGGADDHGGHDRGDDHGGHGRDD
jgi:hypothetical protein